MSNVFKEIEKTIKEKLPIGIEKIIEHAGFDTKSSILEINTERISEIEQYVNDNKYLLENTVYNHIFQQNLEFKFKPGHKALILSFPNLFKNNNDNPKRGTKRKLEVERDGSEARSENQEINEAELTQKLIAKITKYGNSNSVEIIFDNNSIKNLRVEGTKIKCDAYCPVCQAKSTCTFTTFWLASNFERHLKKTFQ